jgi:energy-coupling factor transport system ATP-binding protein
VSEKAVIQCEELCHTYQNGVQALRGINLTIQQGEYLALVGQNGSGKTTLAKHFNGLLKPTSGSVRVTDTLTTEVRVSALSRKVGYVFQNPDDMLFCSSVEEEIGFGMKMQGAPAEEIQTRVDQIIRELNQEDLRDEHPFALSLGDRQRVAVACALCLDPEIFVFDEPTTGQDYIGGKAIMQLIDHLHETGKTIVIITHDMPIVAEHARRVVVMHGGQIMLDGTTAEVFNRTDQLEQLSLKPPQVVRLGQRLGCAEQNILTVAQMSNLLRRDAHPAEGGL